MEEVRLVFKHNENFLLSKSPISFKFTRERYTPYTQCTGVVIGDTDVYQVNSIEVYYKNQLIHRGMADNISKVYKNGRYIITFLSRGFTMLLGQNEPKPGIITDVSLGSLISMNTQLPNVSWEATPANVNYIYVKERSTIWDAICVYAYKAYGNYPYITESNTVRASIPQNSKIFDYKSEEIVSTGENLSTSGMLSTVYMSDSEGEYAYTKNNENASSYKIVRKKYYPLDRQWLADPSGGLFSKLKYSNHGFSGVSIKYKGHLFENLMDIAKFQLGPEKILDNEYIGKVEVTGNKFGVFTTIIAYRDSYA